MKNIIKTFGLLSIFAVIPASFAATSRVSMVSKASPRLPSIAGYVKSIGTTTNVVGGSNVSYLADPDCIDNYTTCITGDDACGSDFSECTTNILLHAKMPVCSNILSQCTAAGRTALFGSGDIGTITTTVTRNANNEITDYTYPLSTSRMGEWVAKGMLENRLGMADCVKRYTNCVKRDSVCGENFELCTGKNEFKKQALFCDSTLARCESAGKIELFGSTEAAKKLEPTNDSRLGVEISEGASLAAANAVLTCQKVVDNCFTNACAKNPWRCVEGTSMATITSADIVAGGKSAANALNAETAQITKDANGAFLSSMDDLYKLTGQDVRKFFKTACLSTIGSNRYCYMTFEEKTPREKDLTDIENQEDVFSLAYAARKDAINTKLQDVVREFDTRAKDKCIETIQSCAMRSCGGGIGSVCYKRARNNDGSVVINDTKTYKDIQSGCAAIVNADANCQYAATAAGEDGYTYSYTKENVFETLFPTAEKKSDPIGVVASLNASLATSYNDAAIDNMRKQCQTVALSCVKSMCGSDYTNCYRNRTDVVDGTYDTGSGKFDRSMNKVGGVLDYNIVIGLCMNTVKNAAICEEHLKVAAADWRETQDTDSWGGNSTVRSGWLGANAVKDTTDTKDEVIVGCMVPESGVSENCPAYSQAATNEVGTCVGVMDEDGCLYSEPVKMGQTEYVLENAGKTLFQELLRDVEREAHQIFNSKLTKEQNICRNNNNGGIRGAVEHGSTFMWAKLRSNKVPKNYQMAGLKSKDFIESNDLYGSFCRARITVTSDDKDIQSELGDEATAYFATGDAFTCGSWIKQSTLDRITKKVRERAEKDAGRGSAKEKIAYAWGTVAPALAGGIGGAALADSMQRNGGLGGLLHGDAKNNKKAAENCLDEIESARRYYSSAISSGSNTETAANYMNRAVEAANRAKRYARSVGANVSDLEFVELNGYTAGADAVPGTKKWSAKATEYARTLDGIYTTVKTSDNRFSDSTFKNIADAMNSWTQSALKTMQQSPTDGNINTVVTALNMAIAKCNQMEPGLCSNDTFTSEDVVESNNDGKAAIASTKMTNADAVYGKFSTNLNKLENACSDVNDGKEYNSGKTWGGAAVGTVVGGALGAGITASVLEAKYENAGNEAVKQWMDEIGEHIQCYVGSEELGTYGDVISIELN